MGLVSQEPVLFNDTIRANIAYGKEGNATEAEVLAAAELANAHKFISGLQQVISLNTITLSIYIDMLSMEMIGELTHEYYITEL